MRRQIVFSLNPKGYKKKIDDVRRIGLRQFRDYGLWFKVEADATVIACISGRRDLRLVRERVDGVIEIKPRPQ